MNRMRNDRGVLPFLLTFVFVFAVVASAQAVPLFLPPVPYGPVAIGGFAIASGDLNGDGRQDVVVSGACATTCTNIPITVFLGNGDGTLANSVSYDSGGFTVVAVAIADVNGDGHSDIVIADGCVAGETHCGTGLAANGNVGVLLGNGDGTFQPVVLYDAGGEGTASLAIADVNLDGKPDVIVTNWDDRFNHTNAVGVLLGNGDGTFKPMVPYNSGGCGFEEFAVAVADVNGDGKPDIMVANSNGDDTRCGDGTIGVLLGHGDGTFGSAVTYSAGGALTDSIAVADVNGDGKPDLVVANFCAVLCHGDGSVGVMLGNGDGTFRPSVTYDSGGYAFQSLAVADVNGDGKLDVLVTNRCEQGCKKGSVGALLGVGDGTFKKVVGYDKVLYNEALTIADLNGDGRPDIIVVNACPYCNNQPIRVLLNNPAVVYSTITALTSSPNPSQLGQSVTLTAQVSSKNGVIRDGDLVTFFDGKKQLASMPVSNGQASYTTSALTAKTHSLKAVYAGSPWNKSSTGFTKQVVDK